MQRGRLATWLVWAWEHWATRSLAVGAIATAIDISFGTSLLELAHVPTRWAAMSGVVLGAAFTFVANRYFAFREHNPKLAKPAVRFVVVTFLASIVHAQVVVWLRDGLGVPFVIAKMIADIAIFTVGQLVLFRYIVFPKQKPAPEEEEQPESKPGHVYEVPRQPEPDPSRPG